MTTTDTNGATVTDGTNWVVEAELPASDLLGVTFSASTDLRIGLLINDRDDLQGLRDGIDILTGGVVVDQRFTTGQEGLMHCVDVTLVN